MTDPASDPELDHHDRTEVTGTVTFSVRMIVVLATLALFGVLSTGSGMWIHEALSASEDKATAASSTAEKAVDAATAAVNLANSIEKELIRTNGLLESIRVLSEERNSTLVAHTTRLNSHEQRLDMLERNISVLEQRTKHLENGGR